MSKLFDERVRHDRFTWDEGDVTVYNPDGTVAVEGRGFDPDQPIPPQPEPTEEHRREARKIQRRFESGALQRLAYGEATVEEIEADTVIGDGEE